MAIGVGLFASVMATWEPNERFTYGYACSPVSNLLVVINLEDMAASKRYPDLRMEFFSY